MNETLVHRRTFGLALALIVSFAFHVAPSFADNRCADGGRPFPKEQRRGPGDEGGVGGTGADPSAENAAGFDSEGGIGGTGISKAPGDEGGVGGTGLDQEGETAVTGTVTGFASICVGATEIHYDADTPFVVDGVEVPVDQLAIGQVVAVVAQGGGDEVVAREIVVDHVLSGPVTATDSGNAWIEVMGQRVLLSEAAVPEPLSEGTWVDVSGLWRSDGVVVASRIDGGLGERARVVGRLDRPDGDRGRIGAVSLLLKGAAEHDAPSEVIAVGSWSDGVLVTESLQVSPSASLPSKVRRAQIEGYVERTGMPQQVEIAGWTVEVPEAERASWASIPHDRRVQLRGVVDRNGRLIPKRLRFPEPRRYQLGTLQPRAARPQEGGAEGAVPRADAPAGPAHPRMPPPGAPNGGKPPGVQHNGPPPRPRAARPPIPDRLHRPEIPRAQRPPPPPRGGRPPPPPPPRPPR